MNDDPSRKRLGRGLAALIGEMDQPANAAPGVVRSADGRVPIAFVSPNPRNPRRNFSDAELADLAQSIREHGVVQPVVVRPSRAMPGHYEIIAGERRWRASQAAGLHEIPVVVREMDDATGFELALIENIQRADLNPIEEAEGYRRLIGEFGHSQEQLGKLVHKSRSHIANLLRLLDLPERVMQLLIEDKITMGHARALITADDPEKLAEEVVRKGLSVRQTEALARASKEAAAGKKNNAAPTAADADVMALERQLADVLGLKVQIANKGSAGEITIGYSTLDQLDMLCQRLSGENF